MYQVAWAYILDLIIGDPAFLPHPVVMIGKAIDSLEKLLRKLVAPRFGLRTAGLLLTITVVAGTYAVMAGLLFFAYKVNEWLGLVLSIWFLSTTIAVKGLRSAAIEIYDLLKAGNIQEARKKVGWIVGRDTDTLDESEIARATVETVAENIVDGITAPLFYAFIGGAPLAMAYKAVNTLDSMVGYKNEKYRDLGWASAKFDDLCNYLPARLTGVILLLTFLVSGKNTRGAWQTILRDAPKHPSPNSGIPEAAVAGALGVQLGGYNSYGGVRSLRAYMGNPDNTLGKEHIFEVVKVMQIASAIFVLLESYLMYAFAKGLL